MIFFDSFKRCQELAIDLGTANTMIIQNDELVVNEPSIVAIDKTTDKVIAIGRKAMLMHEKTHGNLKTVRPLVDGVIANLDFTESMLKEMMRMILRPGQKIAPNWKMTICIPSNITEVERRAVRDSAENAGAKVVHMIHEPIAAALGMGIDVCEPNGSMIVDIGGGTTGISIIALGGIVCDQSIRIAGDEFTADIKKAIRQKHSLLIGERTAEEIKIKVGSALRELDLQLDDLPVNGRDIVTGIPKQIVVTYPEVAEALEKSIRKIEDAILKTLEVTPPELSSDIYRRGIYLTGGGALLAGLAKRLNNKVKLNVSVAEDPIQSVVRGTAIAMKRNSKLPLLFR